MYFLVFFTESRIIQCVSDEMLILRSRSDWDVRKWKEERETVDVDGIIGSQVETCRILLALEDAQGMEKTVRHVQSLVDKKGFKEKQLLSIFPEKVPSKRSKLTTVGTTKTASESDTDSEVLQSVTKKNPSQSIKTFISLKPYFLLSNKESVNCASAPTSFAEKSNSFICDRWLVYYKLKYLFDFCVFRCLEEDDQSYFTPQNSLSSSVCVSSTAKRL